MTEAFISRWRYAIVYSVVVSTVALILALRG